MSKALEALEDIILYLNASEPKGLYCENIETIQQALLKAEKEHKALEIIKEHIKFDDRGIETYTDDFKNLVTKFLIRLESKDTGATFHIHLDTEEEFDLLKEVLE